MSKKRTSPESSNDEQKNEGSDSVFQQDDNAKRVKLTTLSDTTLQDLPMELIERILVKAVAMEVMGMTRKEKAVWKEKADPVIRRLTAVCSQWRNILTTNFFRNELHRTFDAEKTIRLEILHKSPLQVFVSAVIPLKDELFILCKPHGYYVIHVYDRNKVSDLNAVIQLPGIEPGAIAACGVSNCLYILNNKKHHLSVLRITKTGVHKFSISPLISDMRRRNDSLSVAANGNLILTWNKRIEQRGVISVYDPNGHLQYETWLSSDICRFSYDIIPKSNGNFVVVSSNEQRQTGLTEIDMYGTILRQYQSSLFACHTACHADMHGRIVIFAGLNGIELLDSEFKLLDFNGPQQDADKLTYCGRIYHNRDRNEVVTVLEDDVLTILRFTEE